MLVISLAIWCVWPAVLWASSRTSLATWAKVAPSCPARAASTAAFSDSMFVRAATSSIREETAPICSSRSARSWTFSLVSATCASIVWIHWSASFTTLRPASVASATSSVSFADSRAAAAASSAPARISWSACAADSISAPTDFTSVAIDVTATELRAAAVPDSAVISPREASAAPRSDLSFASSGWRASPWASGLRSQASP